MRKSKARRRRRSTGLGLPDPAHVNQAIMSLRRARVATTCSNQMHWMGRAEAHIESIVDRSTRENLESKANRLTDRAIDFCERVRC